MTSCACWVNASKREDGGFQSELTSLFQSLMLQRSRRRISSELTNLFLKVLNANKGADGGFQSELTSLFQSLMLQRSRRRISSELTNLFLKVLNANKGADGGFQSEVTSLFQSLMLTKEQTAVFGLSSSLFQPTKLFRLNVVLCMVSMELKTVFEYALWLTQASVFKFCCKCFNHLPYDCNVNNGEIFFIPYCTRGV